MPAKGRPRIFVTKPKPITFYLEEVLLKKIKVVAGQVGVSNSEFIRIAIKEAIEKRTVS